jgi:hypothetical protein
MEVQYGKPTSQYINMLPGRNTQGSFVTEARDELGKITLNRQHSNEFQLSLRQILFLAWVLTSILLPLVIVVSDPTAQL